MKNRIIGSVGFVTLFYASLYFELFPYLLVLFLIVGAYEILKLWTIARESNFVLYLLFYTGIFVVGLVALMLLYVFKPIYIFCLISGIMVNDTFAYLIGRKFGKTKFSRTSPNKSIEGLIGGCVSALIVYVIYTFILGVHFESKFDDINFGIQLFIIMMTLFAGVVGDLLESKLKRLADIKDSGTIVYGHGGILDRIDSWVLASIIFVALILLFT